MSRIMPAMSDGRLTSYASSCILENQLQRQFAVQGETMYRSTLQHNAAAVDKAAKDKVQILPYHGTHQCPTLRR